MSTTFCRYMHVGVWVRGGLGQHIFCFTRYYEITPQTHRANLHAPSSVSFCGSISLPALGIVSLFNFCQLMAVKWIDLLDIWFLFGYSVPALNTILCLSHFKNFQQICIFCGPGGGGVVVPLDVHVSACHSPHLVYSVWTGGKWASQMSLVLMTLQQPCRSAKVKWKQGRGGFLSCTSTSRKATKIKMWTLLKIHGIREKLIN